MTQFSFLRISRHVFWSPSALATNPLLCCINRGCFQVWSVFLERGPAFSTYTSELLFSCRSGNAPNETPHCSTDCPRSRRWKLPPHPLRSASFEQLAIATHGGRRRHSPKPPRPGPAPASPAEPARAVGRLPRSDDPPPLRRRSWAHQVPAAAEAEAGSERRPRLVGTPPPQGPPAPDPAPLHNAGARRLFIVVRWFFPRRERRPVLRHGLAAGTAGRLLYAVELFLLLLLLLIPWGK